jgi:hypothetical protein
MIRWRKTLGAILLIATLLVTAVACSRGGGPLDRTQWKLVGWTLSSLYPGDFTITAAFAGGKISGKSAVNSYGGPYKAGPGSAFSVGELESTLMAGPEPAMRAERAYLTLLGQARSYKMAGGTLTLYDEGANESLIFEAVARQP